MRYSCGPVMRCLIFSVSVIKGKANKILTFTAFIIEYIFYYGKVQMVDVKCCLF